MLECVEALFLDYLLMRFVNVVQHLLDFSFGRVCSLMRSAGYRASAAACCRFCHGSAVRCALHAVPQASSVHSESAVGTPSLRAPSSGGPSLRIDSSSLGFDMQSVASGSLRCGCFPVFVPLQALWLGSPVPVLLQAL